MIVFNLVYITLVILTGIMIYASSMYIKLMSMTAHLVAVKEVGEELKNNKRHKAFVVRLQEEYEQYTSLWQPIGWAALGYLMSSYMFAAANEWKLTEMYVIIGVGLLTPVVAKLYVDKPDFKWLVDWHATMRAILTIRQRDAIVEKIALLESADQLTEQQEDELAQLHEALFVFNEIIGTPNEPSRSGDKE